MLKKLFVYFLLAGAITYAGILFGTPYYHYYGIKSDMDELVLLRNLRDTEMVEEVQESINYYDIPVKMSSVSIQRDEQRHFMVSFSWKETVNFFDLYEKTHNFSIDVKGSDI
jgi:hypothetical protein